MTILFPSGVSFAHVFASHEHHVCLDHGDGHYHEQNVDCEFFQFRQNQNFLSETPTFNLLVLQEVTDDYFFHYSFIPEQDLPSFLVRGPPSYTLI